jgi:hypothetical protein
MSCLFMATVLHLSTLTAPPADVDSDASAILDVHPTGCTADDTDPDRARAVILKLPDGTFQTATLDQP